MGKTFSWLHLTDLHWGAKTLEDRIGNIHEQLLLDIANLRDKCGQTWDAVFFTGDATLGAKEQEFQEVSELLGRLREGLRESGSKPVFLPVPGNHDFRRVADKDDDGYNLFLANTEFSLKKIWEQKKEAAVWQTMENSFAAYCQWEKAERELWNSDSQCSVDIKTGILPGDFRATLQKDDLQVGVTGFNSALLHILEGNCYQKMVISPAQLTALHGPFHNDWYKQHHFNLLLTHHPPEWLDPVVRQEFESNIAVDDRFALHLCGHQHEGYSIDWATGGSSLRRRFLANSLFGRREYEIFVKGKAQTKEDRRHGYCAGVAHFADSRVTTRLFPRWLVPKGAGGWKFDRDVHHHLEEDGGTTPFVLQLSRPYEEKKRSGKRKKFEFKGRGFRGKIKENVAEIMRKKNMKTLLDHASEVSGEHEADVLFCELMSEEAEQGFDVFHECTEKSLQSIVEEGVSADHLDMFKKEVDNILGWLILLTLDDDWLKQNASRFTVHAAGLLLKLPLQTPTGIEIIIARINGHQAVFQVKGDRTEGINGVSKTPETGWSSVDYINEIKKEIHIRVFLGESTPEVFSGADNRKLNAQIKLRERRGRSYYVSILSGDKQNPLNNPATYDVLKKDLPAINTVFFGETEQGDIMFIPDEYDVSAWVYDFLIMLDKY